jgi:hypothetical protein
MEMLLDRVNYNIREAIKKFQVNKNKEYKKTQKQINELIGALNKYQSERNTKHNGRPLQQTRTSRRQNLRT